MNPPDPIALTRTHDAGLNAARNALSGLTDRQAIEVLGALMLRRGAATIAEMTTEAALVGALPR